MRCSYNQLGEVRNPITGNVAVFIEDLNGPRSVTNDAEEVFENFQKVYGKGNFRLFYLDSEGDPAEIRMGTTWTGSTVKFLPMCDLPDLKEYTGVDLPQRLVVAFSVW